MFQSVAEIAAVEPHQSGRRTYQPVRRHSRAAGREGVFWRPTDRKTMHRIRVAAEKFELSAKPLGRKNGPLGGVALEILRLFENIISHKTGRLDPSIEYLMRTLRRSRDAIVRALKALRAHGFLDWLRRYVPTGAEGRGPQVQQTSNAYRLFLPAAAARLLGRMGLAVPVPDDHSHRQQQRKTELDAYAASLSNEQRALFLIEDDDLAASLARLGAALDKRKERESGSRTESPC